jgi:hypothetical protein
MTKTTETLWCIRCLGSNDLFAAKSKEEAEATSAAHNRLIDKHQANHPLRESMKTVAEPWPYSAEAHAQNLIDNEDQP